MAIGRPDIYGNSSAARAADVPLLPSPLTASFSVRGKVTWYSPCVFLGRVRLLAAEIILDGTPNTSNPLSR